MIEDRVSAGVKMVEEKFTKNFVEMERTNEHRRKISDFMANTPDFVEHAKEIDEYIDNHGIANVKVAYDAVKGLKLQERYKEDEQKRAAEAAKDMAANASGGSSQTTAKLSNEDLADRLIAGHRNPNVL